MGQTQGKDGYYPSGAYWSGDDIGAVMVPNRYYPRPGDWDQMLKDIHLGPLPTVPAQISADEPISSKEFVEDTKHQELLTKYYRLVNAAKLVIQRYVVEGEDEDGGMPEAIADLVKEI